MSFHSGYDSEGAGEHWTSSNGGGPWRNRITFVEDEDSIGVD